MNISPKRKKDHNATCDIISELPGNIIDCILERLPLRDAARTSILSTKWRYMWVTLPHLVFDDQFFVNDKVLQEFELVSIINKVLLLHCGPIHKFVLHAPILSLTSSPDINQWILFLSRNGIKVLTLDFLNMPNKLSSSVFSCLELTHLKLRNCTLNSLPTFRGFPNLIFLDLFSITFEANIFETLISSSPLLESLTIKFCSGINDQNIDAPNLKSFILSDTYNFIHLRNTPNLSVVSIKVSSPSSKRDNLIKFLGCLPRIEKLTVAGKSLKSLTWKHAGVEPVEDFLKAQNCLDGTWNRLQIVKLRCIFGFRHEMEFIKLLLACSPLLERMIIEQGENFDANAGSLKSKDFMKELMRFCRVSPKAETIYMDLQ